MGLVKNLGCRQHCPLGYFNTLGLCVYIYNEGVVCRISKPSYFSRVL